MGSLSNGAPFKYKKRKVSCIRDFPPGCGRNAPRMNLKPRDNEAVASLSNKENLMADEKKENAAKGDGVEGFESGSASLSQQVVESAVRNFPPEDAPNINLKPDKENFMADEKRVNVGEGDGVEAFARGDELLSLPVVESGVKLELPGSLDDLVGRVVAAAGVKVETSDLPKALEIEESNKDMSDEKAPSVMNSDGGKSVLEIGSVADRMASAGGSKTWSPPQWPIINDANVLTDTTLKKKLPRRRVSAIRNFPPFCGRSAPRPTEEERQRILLGNKSPCPPDKAVVEGEVLKESVRAVSAEEQGSSPVIETTRTGAEELDGNSQKCELKECGKAAMQGNPSIEKSRAHVEVSPVREKAVAAVEELNGDGSDGHTQKRKLEGRIPEQKTKSQKVISEECEDANVAEGEAGKEIVVYPHDKSFKRETPPGDDVDSGHDNADRVIVQGMMAAPNCLWRQITGSEERRHDIISSVSRQEKPKSARKLKAKKSIPCGKAAYKGKGELVVRDEGDLAIQEQGEDSSAGSERRDDIIHSITRQDKPRFGRKRKAKKSIPCGKAAYKGKGELVVRDEGDFAIQERGEDSSAGKRPNDFEVTLPPFGPNTLIHGDERNKVREMLRLFQAICRKLLQAEEAKLRQKGDKAKRIDMEAAQIVKEKGKVVNTEKFIIGSVPGVEVGDEFQYRVELHLVGIHRPYQGGIDYTKQDGTIIATSIVASGAYADDLDNPDVLIYSGQGGNPTGKDKQPEDQKLERGNLALKNSIDTKNPVRVVRGFKETKAASKSDARAKVVPTYTYDGLYTVERYWHDVGQHGKLVYMFELRRIPGQPELAWKEVKKSNKFKIREGVCVDDISKGKELFPICAVNTIDDELPPTFNYITEMKYPDWYDPTHAKSCDCTGGCSDLKKCLCVVKNGGEIPYNYNGAIVEAKPLVYECGPSCKCPPSCYNRVSQHGIKIQLEIFKTESRGWGVRSLTSIPSGSFICEYFGELIEDKEAEQRHNDEYLFDIGKNYSDCSLTDELSTEVLEDGCFTIDAARFGNVGRFINHSCSPNLYAQNVLYDHEDKKMPHIMLFAAENIPPLQELTYHYNYTLDQVRDSSGNIKMKNCYCGSAECSGRMY